MHINIDRLCQAAKRFHARQKNLPGDMARSRNDIHAKYLRLTSLTLEFPEVESLFHSREDRLA
jgi:hypothetical protein